MIRMTRLAVALPSLKGAAGSASPRRSSKLASAIEPSPNPAVRRNARRAMSFMVSSWSESRKPERRKYETNPESEDDPFDDQGRSVEIEKQADIKAGRFQVRPDLCIVNVLQRFDRLEFYDDF